MNHGCCKKEVYSPPFLNATGGEVSISIINWQIVRKVQFGESTVRD